MWPVRSGQLEGGGGAAGRGYRGRAQDDGVEGRRKFGRKSFLIDEDIGLNSRICGDF